MTPAEITALPEEELRKLLITADYKGKEVKAIALDELLERERERGWSDGYDVGHEAGHDAGLNNRN